jgi:histidine triad (HIT) family protein
MSTTCAFCRIAWHEVPAYIFLENAQVIAFLSKNNHPLIVPKQHIPNIYTLDESTGAAIMNATIQLARAVKRGLQCEGVYVTQANEPAAGQDVFHLHMHIYPRWHTVALETQQGAHHVADEERQATWTRILACLEQPSSSQEATK